MDSTTETEVAGSQLSMGDWLRVCWGFFWRGLIYILAITIVAGLAGALIGAAIAVVAKVFGASVPSGLVLQVVGGSIGLVVSVFGFTVYLRWLLRARFGSLRFALIRTHAPAVAAGIPSKGAA